MGTDENDWREITTHANDASSERRASSQFTTIRTASTEPCYSDAAAQSVNLPLVIWLKNFRKRWTHTHTHTRVASLLLSALIINYIIIMCGSLCREGVSRRDDARVWVLICLSSDWEVEKIETTAEIIVVSQRPLNSLIWKCDETNARRRGRHGASAIYSYVCSSLIPAMLLFRCKFRTVALQSFVRFRFSLHVLMRSHSLPSTVVHVFFSLSFAKNFMSKSMGPPALTACCSAWPTHCERKPDFRHLHAIRSILFIHFAQHSPINAHAPGGRWAAALSLSPLVRFPRPLHHCLGKSFSHIYAEKKKKSKKKKSFC